MESTILKIIVGFSSYTMVLFGVDYYALVYALIGTMLLLSKLPKTTRLRAIGYVALSTISGAAAGNLTVEYFDTVSKFALFVACMVCGGGAHLLLSTAIDALVNRTRQAGGVQ